MARYRSYQQALLAALAEEAHHKGGIVDAATLRSVPFPFHKGAVLPTSNPSVDEAVPLRVARDVSFAPICIKIDWPPERRKPVTDDMAQMCADLGIEPQESFFDFKNRVHREITARMKAVPFDEGHYLK